MARKLIDVFTQYDGKIKAYINSKVPDVSNIADKGFLNDKKAINVINHSCTATAVTAVFKGWKVIDGVVADATSKDFTSWNMPMADEKAAGMITATDKKNLNSLADGDYAKKTDIPDVSNFVTRDELKSDDEYEYVDLGLPSGTLWATKNIGAKDEHDTGLYFQWGDTQGYTAEQVGKDKVFNWDNYKFGKYDSSDKTNYGMTKYNKTDGKTVLDAEDDAATVNMGAKWKMPTQDQITELINNTNKEVHLNLSDEVGYIKFISKTDSSKFLIIPASGNVHDGSVHDVGSNGAYWLSSFNKSYVVNGHHWDFYGMNVYDNDRNFGFSVRAIVNPDYKELTIPTKLSELENDIQPYSNTVVDITTNQELSAFDDTKSFINTLYHNTSAADVTLTFKDVFDVKELTQHDVVITVKAGEYAITNLTKHDDVWTLDYRTKE